MSGKRIFVRGLLALIFAALLIAGGLAIYQAGFARGALTNLSLPESGAYTMLPFAHSPLGWRVWPRIGLLGIFPLLCFGSFFFLMLLFGFGFFARKRTWMHYPCGPHSDYWKHYGPPPWAQNQPEAGGEAPAAEKEDAQG